MRRTVLAALALVAFAAPAMAGSLYGLAPTYKSDYRTDRKPDYRTDRKTDYRSDRRGDDRKYDRHDDGDHGIKISPLAAR